MSLVVQKALLTITECSVNLRINSLFKTHSLSLPSNKDKEKTVLSALN